jgi:hypothetical protein
MGARAMHLMLWGLASRPRNHMRQLYVISIPTSSRTLSDGSSGMRLPTPRNARIEITGLSETAVRCCGSRLTKLCHDATGSGEAGAPVGTESFRDRRCQRA